MPIGKDKLSLYPSLDLNHLSLVQNALCPFKVDLPTKLKHQIGQVCDEFIAFKKETSQKPWSDSVLNSLDFHYSNDSLKIIEANTNASGFLLSNLLLKEESKITDYEQTLFSSFETVFKGDFKTVYINDENPIAEKMYAEFLMFKDFFKRHGVSATITQTKDIKVKDSKIYLYNRDTDFYLEKNPVLKVLWSEGVAYLSTNPHTYENIADKKNSVELSKIIHEERYSNLKNSTLLTKFLTEQNKEELWSERKKLFFKPSSSFGSKGVYSGKSISRKKFDELDDKTLSQEAHPPGKVEVNKQTWKFDIRAYFSEGPVQKILCRLYQGQVTNFSNPGGGFALINWID